MCPIDMEVSFNNCLTASEANYKSHLLDPECSLEREGPMTLAEARSSFLKNSRGTHPLYILLQSDGYYVYY